jgi:hypothetical protein
LVESKRTEDSEKKKMESSSLRGSEKVKKD